MRNWISCVLKFSCSGNCERKVTGRQNAWGFSTKNVKALTVTCVRAVSTPRPTPENTEPLWAYRNCNLPKIWRGSVYGSKQLYACRNICSQLYWFFASSFSPWEWENSTLTLCEGRRIRACPVLLTKSSSFLSQEHCQGLMCEGKKEKVFQVRLNVWR